MARNLPKNCVILLGTKGGPAIRQGSANPTSSLIVMDGKMAIVDCGLGVTRSLVDQGVDLKELSLIFITHLHSDHYLELGPLLHTAWTAGLKTPVTVIAPVKTRTYWEHFLISMQDDIALRIEDEGRPDLASLVKFVPLDAGDVYHEGELSVSALRNDHPPLKDSFALKFSSSSKSVVFSGDTACFPPLAEFCKHADLLVHEAMLPEALEALFSRIGNGDERLMKHLKRSHTRAKDVGLIATKANVKALALNHLIPSDDPDYQETQWHEALQNTWQGVLHVGTDGMIIEF